MENKIEDKKTKKIYEINFSWVKIVYILIIFLCIVLMFTSMFLPFYSNKNGTDGKGFWTNDWNISYIGIIHLCVFIISSGLICVIYYLHIKNSECMLMKDQEKAKFILKIFFILNLLFFIIGITNFPLGKGNDVFNLWTTFLPGVIIYSFFIACVLLCILLILFWPIIKKYWKIKVVVSNKKKVANKEEVEKTA